MYVRSLFTLPISTYARNWLNHRISMNAVDLRIFRKVEIGDFVHYHHKTVTNLADVTVWTLGNQSRSWSAQKAIWMSHVAPNLVYLRHELHAMKE